jgi:hypothetical protein
MAKTIADLILARFGLPTRAGETMPAEAPSPHCCRIASTAATSRTRSTRSIEIALAAALSAPSKSDLQQMGSC